MKKLKRKCTIFTTIADPLTRCCPLKSAGKLEISHLASTERSALAVQGEHMPAATQASN